VLRNNYLQSQAISTSEFQPKERFERERLRDPRARAFRRLEPLAGILPTEEEIAERLKAGEGLTRPELAITLSYGKSGCTGRSSIPTFRDPYLSTELARYFPTPVRSASRRD